MNSYQWSDVPEEQMNARVGRKVVHGDKMTVARLRMTKGAFVPVHSHANEQISLIESGAIRFMIDGQEQIVRGGGLMRIPPHVPHSAEALEDSVAVDIFSPVREDWLRGEDAYLRK